MINEREARRYCYEDLSLIENYNKAIADTSQTWHCHHRIESIMNCSPEELIAKDCYENRPAHDLIFLTKSEHSRLHMSMRFKNRQLLDEHRAKIAATLKGTTLPAQQRAKIAAAARQQWKKWREEHGRQPIDNS